MKTTNTLLFVLIMLLTGCNNAENRQKEGSSDISRDAAIMQCI